MERCPGGRSKPKMLETRAPADAPLPLSLSHVCLARPSSPRGQTLCGRLLALDWLSFTIAPTLAKGEIERRQHEQVDQGRGEQAAEDHYRHGVLDLVPRNAASYHERDQREASRQRGHHDRR